MNYLGRCREPGCGFALFATREDVKEADSFRDVKSATAARVPNGVFGRCSNNHRVFPMKVVQGTYSAVHECDSRCLNAKGNNCTCSCGGANHGRGHASVVEVPSEQPVSKHLGEIGKHITGTARVVTVREIASDFGTTTMYAFRTERSGAVIKWFAPSYADPQYKLNQAVTFRAKVKRHDTYQDEAQTVVTYLEEVEE